MVFPSPPRILLVLCNQDPLILAIVPVYGDDWGIRNPECDLLQLLNYFPNPKIKSGKLQGDDSHHLLSRKILLAIRCLALTGAAGSHPCLLGPLKGPSFIESQPNRVLIIALQPIPTGHHEESKTRLRCVYIHGGGFLILYV